MKTNTIPATIENIAQCISGQIISISNNRLIKNLLIDSRNLTNTDDALFFAIKGKRHDGHNYIEEAYNKGVRCFVVEEIANPLPKDASIIKVENSLKALQKLAAWKRKQYELPVIAITGSNGKTIVKEWLYQLMYEDKQIVRSPKSYNSQVGVPLSVWQIKDTDKLGIFEAGISEPDEMQQLQQVIQPTIGLFTNIGTAHGENFIHINQKIGEKLKLFSHVETLLYCVDHFEIKDRIIKSGLSENLAFFTWSFTRQADLRITKIEKQGKKTDIQGLFQEKTLSITIPFTDDAAINNAVSCWASLLFLGYDNNVIADRASRLSPVAMRLELKEGINNCTIINDAYNSDINSLSIALDFLEQQKQNPGKTLIISDILQSEQTEASLYAEVANLIQNKGVSKIIGIGEAISRHKKLFHTQAYFFNSTGEFLKDFSVSSFQNEAILLKGARKFRFERISRLIQQKAHDTVLEIDLNALVSNLNYYKSLLKPETKIMAMIKAFGYGNGSFEIANLLQFHRVDYLAVAYTDEGLELRKAGISMPIMVMNPDYEGMGNLIANNLEPEVYSFRLLDMLNEAIEWAEFSENVKVKIHIKIDTGMHRLGFLPEDMEALAALLNKQKQIELLSVFTHLTSSGKPEDDNYTAQQLQQFNEAVEVLRKNYDKPFMTHVLNSSGVERHSKAQMDMVRLGIGLYGAGSTQKNDNLIPVATLKTSISQVRKVKTGETVGYNRNHTATQDTFIATIPVGYADGLKRILGNGNASVYINGEKFPIVGDICMDMSMIDIGNAKISEGDEVIIFGKEISLEEIARKAGTISYEILSGLSRRIKRVYFQE